MESRDEKTIDVKAEDEEELELDSLMAAFESDPTGDNADETKPTDSGDAPEGDAPASDQPTE